MALPINIEELLRKRRVESERIEFKRGWNPTDIYRSIDAFANDFDNLGGGYVVVGVEEQNGVAKRPVVGIDEKEIDNILKQMVGFNNLIDPYYLPRTSVEEIDGKLILVIWVPSGVNRPYAVPADVLAKVKKLTYYVRSGSSSIVAKGEVLDELRDLANRTPFDDRPNPKIKMGDISMALLRDYLAKVDSKLERALFSQPLEQTLEQMDLMDGPTENRMLKNVAAMMFCEHPEKIFRYAQVDIVIFPEGRLGNPNNFSETTIHGSVPQMIQGTLNFLKTTIIQEYVRKQRDVPESIRFFNYPVQALEEAIVNALYHRDYQIYEPIEVSVEPEGIHILSFPGPDRSISKSSISAGDRMVSRRYRNRRLGDFLKELELTEGRSTGIPTIQEELLKNGSPKATIETNDERSFINIFIPVHEGCGDKVILNESKENSVIYIDDAELAGVNDTQGQNTIDHQPQKLTGKLIEKLMAKLIANAPAIGVRLTVNRMAILRLMLSNPYITKAEIAKTIGISETSVSKNIETMRGKLIERVGADKNGYWKLNI